MPTRPSFSKVAKRIDRTEMHTEMWEKRPEHVQTDVAAPLPRSGVPGSADSCGTWTPAGGGWLRLGTDRGAAGQTPRPRRSASGTSS